MLSGRYPSDEFAELRPRDHLGSRRRARSRRAKARSASRSSTAARFPIAGCSACSCSAPRPGAARVGELDEEMVFETRVGETFVLGASSWRIEEITHDRVLVSPAPGEPGKMPFWKGDRTRPAARARPRDRTADARPAAPAAGRGHRPADTRARSRPRARLRTCCSTCAIRAARTAWCPTPARFVVERVRDELGDWRVCVLSPRGGRDPRAVGDGRRGEDSRGDAASTSRRSGETTGSSCGFRMWTSRRTVGSCCPIRTRCRRSSSASSARRRCSRRSSARTPRGRCCCRSGGPGCARRSGSSGSGRRICWPWPRASGRFPCCSKPTANACATSSTCRRSSSTLADVRSRKIRVATVDSGTSVAVCGVAALQLRRQLSSTTATRRWPSGARRRWRSTRRSCASSSATPSCASCSTPSRWKPSSASCSGSIRDYRAESADGRARHAAVDRRSHRATRSRADASLNVRRRRSDDLRRHGRAACSRCASPARRALHRRRRRGALSATRSACRCRRHSRTRCCSRSRSARRSGTARYARTHAPFTAVELRRSLRARRARRRSGLLIA